MNTAQRISGLACVAAAALALSACASKPQTTVLTSWDMDEATVQMAQSLRQSTFLADRTPASPPIYMVCNKIENLTDDIIPEDEEWMLMARLEGSIPLQEVGRLKNLYLQIPPQRAAQIRKAGFTGEGSSAAAPTHVMTAVFRSSRKGARSSNGTVDGRLDYYTMEYNVTTVNSREVLWSGTFEFKRQAKGKVID